MPVYSPQFNSIVRLYRRCRERRALPCPGGVFDQPEELMEKFDIIDECIAEKKKQLEDETIMEQTRTRLKRELDAGH